MVERGRGRRARRGAILRMNWNWGQKINNDSKDSKKDSKDKIFAFKLPLTLKIFILK